MHGDPLPNHYQVRTYMWCMVTLFPINIISYNGIDRKNSKEAEVLKRELYKFSWWNEQKSSEQRKSTVAIIIISLSQFFQTLIPGLHRPLVPYPPLLGGKANANCALHLYSLKLMVAQVFTKVIFIG